MWDYSPRQVAGFVALAALRRKGEMADRLAINTMAARGEPKAVKEQLKNLGAE